MDTNQYIHINQAVKKYKKTRQTFYNYIHKKLVASKKINNKVYLNIQDIENLLSDYLHIEGSPITGPSSKKENISLNTQIETSTPHIIEGTYTNNNIQQDLLRLHKQYYALEDTLGKKMDHHKKDILFDTKAIQYNQEQKITTQIQQYSKEIEQQHEQLYNSLNLLQKKQKKINFRLSYCGFMCLQGLIIGYILYT